MGSIGGMFQKKSSIQQASDPISRDAFNLYTGALGGIRPQLDSSINSSLANPVFGGQTYADLDPLQQQFYNQMGTFGNAGLGAANNALGLVGQDFANTSGYGARMSNLANSLTDPNAGFNFANNLANSPMADSLIAASSRDISRNLFENQLPGLDRAAIGQGNLNNTRMGVAEGIMRRGAEDRVADIGAAVRNNLFNAGMGQYNTNIAQQTGALGMLAANNNSALGSMNNAFNLGNNAISGIGGAGDFMRMYNQGQLDDMAKQFYMGQDRPMQLAGQYMGLFNPLSSFSGGAGGTQNLEGRSTADTIGDVAQLIGTGMTLFCWVAREVYGEHNFKWRMFRHWMYFDSPRWLHNLYGKYGERFAAFIHNKPYLKRIIKSLMDKAIKQYGGPHGAI